MDRREFVKKTIISSLALGTSLSVDTSFGLKPLSKLTILHTNDMHSRVEPFPEGRGRNSGLGGMARRASLIKQIREEEEHVLLLDAGDIFQGTPYFNFFGGEVEFKLMSEMGYDLATIGNHDFDNGLEGLKEMLPHANFPFVTANYDFSETILNNHFEPYKIFQKGDIKIGVFGLGIELHGLVNDRLSGGTKYLDPIGIATDMVRELEMKQCNLIVCLSHLGYRYRGTKISDQKLAENVSGIDLIIGGHTHTFLEAPEQILNKEGHETIINQVGWAGIKLGRIDYIFDRKKKKKINSSRAIDVK
ncbi:metallophosphatase [Fulvivirgaceae bacterium BMA10]|uniref:Metallophosphatase n=1 Tax=Splendidivirga corallicola TaxID=3051826 RepID=A0ABT8KSS2_9BACT|nr:metallophosphatase [Fulvivirgaceae bacterium BMA10]